MKNPLTYQTIDKTAECRKCAKTSEKIRQNMNVRVLTNRTKTQNMYCIASIAHWLSINFLSEGRVFKPRQKQYIYTWAFSITR